MTVVRRMFIAGSFGLGVISAPSLGMTQQRVAVSTPESVQASTSQLFSRLVTVHLESVSLEKAVSAIATEVGVRIHYQIEDVDAVTRRITLRADGLALGDVLDSILVGTGLRAVSSVPNVITLRADGIVLQATQGVVSGRVVHAKTQTPIPGAKVTVGKAIEGVVTDDKGMFRLTVPVGEQTITVRALGMIRQARTVTVSESAIELMFALEPSASVLDEVIVTGTVVATERRAIPTPITVITAEDLEKRGITRIEQLFRGEVPGVYAVEKGAETYMSGITGGNVRSDIYARGSASLDGGANPMKTYVDGVELLDPSYLGLIDPRSIERIEIITGPQAATIYGSGAMGGVMQIFTKKGNHDGVQDIRLSAKVGFLQNNFSNGITPEHHDVLTVNGGLGTDFSYTGTVSHDYTGQWQPKLFSRRYGGSLGATVGKGNLNASASFSLTNGKNGTWNGEPRLFNADYGEALFIANGEGYNSGNKLASYVSQKVSVSSGHTLSLNVDYRATDRWSHHLTLGRNQTTSMTKPIAANFENPQDTMLVTRRSAGHRVSWNYNTSWSANVSRVSSSMTLGVNGSNSDPVIIGGCYAFAGSSTIVDCPLVQDRISITIPFDDSNWGGFGSWRLGLWESLYATIGFRLEKSRNYGKDIKYDFTPTHGVAYTFSRGELSVKLMGSYGRATKVPNAEWRREQIRARPTYDIGEYIEQFSSPNLRPEYSRGPQGGIELYWGNRGSISLNHYQQTITDLIQRILVDSLLGMRLTTGATVVFSQYQFMNVAKMRQKGWEGTGSLNLGPISTRATYSWNDNRILHQYVLRDNSFSGESVLNSQPSHMGSFRIGYSAGATSVTWSSSWVGRRASPLYNTLWYYQEIKARITTYAALTKRVGLADRAGYMKSNLSGSHRVSPDVSLTLDITNIGNDYRSDLSEWNPTLGRQTVLGVSVRFPR